MSFNTRGNILFLILLAVVLFAALSYAVTSSMRGGGKDVSDEQAQTGAAAITQYVSLIRSEVQRLMMVNDCKLSNLDWRDDYYKRYNGSFAYAGSASNAPVSPKTGCAIFTAYGGNITPQSFEKYKDAAVDSYFAANITTGPMGGHGAFRWLNRKNELTDANEIGFLLFGLSHAVCKKLLGVAPDATLTGDGYTATINANDPEPAPYTTASNIVDTANNITGDYFVSVFTSSGSPSVCQLGTVILPR